MLAETARVPYVRAPGLAALEAKESKSAGHCS